MLAGDLDDRSSDDQRDGLVAVGGERLQVAMVVVLVADQDTIQPRQVGNAQGDRLALVVTGPGAEPGVGQERAPADPIRWQLCVTRVTAVLDMVVIPVFSVIG